MTTTSSTEVTKEIEKKTGALEDKAIDNAKGLVKHIDVSPAETLTLDELNTARQAVVRLNAMIKI